MSTIRVTPELMRGTAQSVQAKTDEWRVAVTKIYQLVQEMDAMWDGLGNDSFNMVFNGDRPNFDNLNALMIEYYNAIMRAAQAYDAGEQEVKNIVTRRR